MSDSQHETGALNSVGICAIVFLCLVCGVAIRKYKLYFLPESGAALIIGGIVGAIAKIFTNNEEMNFLRFKPEMFFFLLLPPIIFEAGFTLKKKRFFRNFSSILLFAVLGTIISTFVIGLSTFAIAKLGIVDLDTSSPLQCLLFGALISAVDPVATLAIMGSPDLNCDKTLYSLVFGESVLNDAVAIVLFKTFEGFVGGQEDSTLSGIEDYVMIGGKFIFISVGSVVIGVMMGLACAMLLKYINLRHHPSEEIVVCFLFAFFSYAAAEVFEFSGIMSLFFCGIMMAHYAWYNMSIESKTSSSTMFKAAAHLTETMVFVYMGLSFFTGEFKGFNPTFVFIAILTCFLGRACNTFPLSFLSNFRRKSPIPFKMQVVLWFAGLRGAIAFALAVNMPDKEETWNNEAIVSTTLCIVTFTTLVCGGLTAPVLGAAGMKRDEIDVDPLDRDPSVQPAPHRAGGLHKSWKNFDKNVMKPFFTLADASVTGDPGQELGDLPVPKVYQPPASFSSLLHKKPEKKEAVQPLLSYGSVSKI